MESYTLQYWKGTYHNVECDSLAKLIDKILTVGTDECQGVVTEVRRGEQTVYINRKFIEKLLY